MISAELVQHLRAASVAISAAGTRAASGSGVIWSEAGLIITNAHVVRMAEPAVTLADGREFRASVLRADRQADLALLRISAQGLPAIVPGNSSGIRAGEVVVAVGNPLGTRGAFTLGVIHANSGRRWIEADVHLAPGNSGGLLADSFGRVIGINTMIQAGLALAIPSDFVRGWLDIAGMRGTAAA